MQQSSRTGLFSRTPCNIHGTEAGLLQRYEFGSVSAWHREIFIASASLFFSAWFLLQHWKSPPKAKNAGLRNRVPSCLVLGNEMLAVEAMMTVNCMFGCVKTDGESSEWGGWEETCVFASVRQPLRYGKGQRLLSNVKFQTQLQLPAKGGVSFNYNVCLLLQAPFNSLWQPPI